MIVQGLGEPTEGVALLIQGRDQIAAALVELLDHRSHTAFETKIGRVASLDLAGHGAGQVGALPAVLALGYDPGEQPAGDHGADGHQDEEERHGCWEGQGNGLSLIGSQGQPS